MSEHQHEWDTHDCANDELGQVDEVVYCREYHCEASYFEWSQAEIKRLRAALTEIMSMSEPAGYGERSKAQIRDAARRALGTPVEQ